MSIYDVETIYMENIYQKKKNYMENRDTLFRNFILYWFLFFQHGAKVMFVWLLIVLYFLCVESPPSNLCCYSFSIQVTHQTSFYTVSYSTKQNLSNPLILLCLNLSANQFYIYWLVSPNKSTNLRVTHH